jgi:hypothetical protein
MVVPCAMDFLRRKCGAWMVADLDSVVGENSHSANGSVGDLFVVTLPTAIALQPALAEFLNIGVDSCVRRKPGGHWETG